MICLHSRLGIWGSTITRTQMRLQLAAPLETARTARLSAALKVHGDMAVALALDSTFPVGQAAAAPPHFSAGRLSDSYLDLQGFTGEVGIRLWITEGDDDDEVC